MFDLPKHVWCQVVAMECTAVQASQACRACTGLVAAHSALSHRRRYARGAEVRSEMAQTAAQCQRPGTTTGRWPVAANASCLVRSPADHSRWSGRRDCGFGSPSAAGERRLDSSWILNAGRSPAWSNSPDNKSPTPLSWHLEQPSGHPSSQLHIQTCARLVVQVLFSLFQSTPFARFSSFVRSSINLLPRRRAMFRPVYRNGIVLEIQTADYIARSGNQPAASR